MPPTHQIYLSGEDLVGPVSDNCTATNDLEFAVRFANSGGSGFPLNANGNPQDLIEFNCDYLGDQAIEVWVRDESGNSSMDIAVVHVYDQNHECGDPFLVPTCGKTEEDQYVENITWTLVYVGSITDIPPTGTWFFNGICNYVVPFPIDGVKVTPQKTQDPLNGVSTFDLVQINKHILGLAQLDSPYKILAADANNSRSVTTFDLVELRKLILGIYPELPKSDSWRFVPQSFQFPNPSNPFQTPVPSSDTLTFNNYEASHNFIACKVGDVNGSALTKAQDNEPDARSIQTLELEDGLLRPGETTRIALHLRDGLAVLGLQFALQFDPEILEIQRVDFNRAQAVNEDFFAFPEPGLLTLSWDDPVTPVLGTEEPVAILEVKARKTVQLSRALHLLPEHRLRPELYTADGETYALTLEFAAPDHINRTEFFAATPNPSNHVAVAIPFALAEPALVMIEVFDPTGRQVYRAEQQFPAGLNQMVVPEAKFGWQTGLLSYRVFAGPIPVSGKILRL